MARTPRRGCRREGRYRENVVFFGAPAAAFLFAHAALGVYGVLAGSVV